MHSSISFSCRGRNRFDFSRATVTDQLTLNGPDRDRHMARGSGGKERFSLSTPARRTAVERRGLTERCCGRYGFIYSLLINEYDFLINFHRFLSRLFIIKLSSRS